MTLYHGENNNQNASNGLSVLDVMVSNKHRKGLLGKKISSVSRRREGSNIRAISGPAAGTGPGNSAMGTGISTLDMKHSDIMASFYENDRRIDGAKRDIAKLTESVRGFELKGLPLLNDDEFSSYMNAKDKIEENRRVIQHLERSKDEEDYLVNVGDILFKYYDVVENGASTPGALPSRVNNPAAHFNMGRLRGGSRRNALEEDMASKKSILTFLSTLNSGTEQTSNLTTQNNYSTDGNRATEDTIEKEDGGGGDDAGKDDGSSTEAEDRASLLGKYVACIKGDNVKSVLNQMHRQKKLPSGPDDVGRCPHCGSSNRIVLMQDGCVYCDHCLTQEYIMIDHDKPSYKDPPKEITYFAYKRINHFNEWLNQIQGKETTDIPEEIYDSILLEFKKQRISNMADLTNNKIRNILRKLGLHTYYEHVPHIKFRLNGIPVPYIPPELEERLRDMFYQIQVPFLRHAPLARKNFLSYSYVLHKFMQLLDKDEYLDSFPLLKSRDKLHVQDQIWQKICKDLHWEFYKSI